MKRFISVLLAVVLIIEMAPAAYAEESITSCDKTPSENMEQKALEVQKTIDLFEEYLIVDEEGFINENEIPKEVVKTVDTAIYQELSGLVDDTNEKIADGDITVTDALTVIDLDDEELVVQGGKVTKLVSHWWGFDLYMSKTVTKKTANLLANTSFGAGVLSAAGGVAFAIAAFTGGSAAPFIGLGAAFATLGDKYCGAISRSLKAHNNSRGTILSVTKAAVYWVAKQ